MKKYIGVLGAVCCMLSVAMAEEMRFITVLSNPVGIFQQVGVTVSSTTVKNLAFGNARSPSGTITTDKLTAGGKLMIQSENAVSLRDGGVGEQALVADAVRFGVTNNKGKTLTVNGTADVKRVFSTAGIKHQSTSNAIVAKTGTFGTFDGTAMKMISPATGDLLRNTFVWEKISCTSGDTTCNNTATNKNSLLLVSSGGAAAVLTCTQNPNQQKCCTSATSSNGCTQWSGSACVVKTCSSGNTLNRTTCVCESSCSNSSYLTSHKSECCPGQYDNPSCYKYEWVDDNVHSGYMGSCNIEGQCRDADWIGTVNAPTNCSAAEVGSQGWACDGDDGGLEQWYDTCYIQSWRYTCTRKKNGW